ncbi:Inositol-pentakisphosphate 2-kinase [Orobanche hederae]
MCYWRRPLQDSQLTKVEVYEFMQDCNVQKKYGPSASFIDLDMKPLKEMKHYYELDQQIVGAYIQMVKDKEAHDCGESIDESSNSYMPKC